MNRELFDSSVEVFLLPSLSLVALLLRFDFFFSPTDDFDFILFEDVEYVEEEPIIESPAIESSTLPTSIVSSICCDVGSRCPYLDEAYESLSVCKLLVNLWASSCADAGNFRDDPPDTDDDTLWRLVLLTGVLLRYDDDAALILLLNRRASSCADPGYFRDDSFECNVDPEATDDDTLCRLVLLVGSLRREEEVLSALDRPRDALAASRFLFLLSVV